MRMNTMAIAQTSQLDKEILADTYRQYSDGIYRYAYRLIGDKHTAEECVSETFSRLIQAVKKGGGPKENVQAYLYRVAHNWVTDYYRRQPPPTSALEIDNHPDPEGNPAHVLDKELEQERVRAALLRLPDDQRKVILLRIYERWSHENVAEVLGKSEEASRALQHRAMVALRRMLIEQEDV